MDIHYRRKIPPEWQLAEAQLGPRILDMPYNAIPPAVLDDASLGVQQLNDENLEINGYYGFGLIMQGMATSLQSRHIYQNTVLSAATQLANRILGHATPRDMHVHADDIEAKRMWGPFISLARRASFELPTPAHALAEVFANAILERRLGATAMSDKLQKQRQESFRKGELAAEIVGVNAASGVIGVLRRCLELSPRKHPTGSKGKEVVTAGDLADLDIERHSLQSATLRLDEFTGGVLREVLKEQDGVIVFDRSALPDKPAPKVIKPGSIRAFLHEQRLGCPAIQVDGLIPLFTTMIPEIIERTQDILDAPPKKFIIPPR